MKDVETEKGDEQWCPMRVVVVDGQVKHVEKKRMRVLLVNAQVQHDMLVTEHEQGTVVVKK